MSGGRAGPAGAALAPRWGPDLRAALPEGSSLWHRRAFEAGLLAWSVSVSALTDLPAGPACVCPASPVGPLCLEGPPFLRPRLYKALKESEQALGVGGSGVRWRGQQQAQGRRASSVSAAARRPVWPGRSEGDSGRQRLPGCGPPGEGVGSCKDKEATLPEMGWGQV